jgi:hypothetical protein
MIGCMGSHHCVDCVSFRREVRKEKEAYWMVEGGEFDEERLEWYSLWSGSR